MIEKPKERKPKYKHVSEVYLVGSCYSSSSERSRDCHNDTEGSYIGVIMLSSHCVQSLACSFG